MNVPSGSVCKITLSKNNYSDNKVIYGVLAEGVTINLQSSYQSLVSDSDVDESVKGKINWVGAGLRSMSGGRLGFSSEFKQYTSQIWKNTEPASFSLNIEFHRLPQVIESDTVISAENVISVVKDFCAATLPDETLAGNLVPPGPSPIEGIGLDSISQNSGLVKVEIGNMCFDKLIMKSAEPTFSQFSDDSGYPISARVAFSFVSLWAATKKMVYDEWWAGR